MAWILKISQPTSSDVFPPAMLDLLHLSESEPPTV